MLTIYPVGAVPKAKKSQYMTSKTNSSMTKSNVSFGAVKPNFSFEDALWSIAGNLTKIEAETPEEAFSKIHDLIKPELLSQTAREKKGGVQHDINYTIPSKLEFVDVAAGYVKYKGKANPDDGLSMPREFDKYITNKYGIIQPKFRLWGSRDPKESEKFNDYYHILYGVQLFFTHKLLYIKNLA